MQLSYSLLFVKLGLSFHPLQAPYTQFELLATHSWMKMLWEKLSRFNVKAVVANVNSAFPREGDEFSCRCLFVVGTPMNTPSPQSREGMPTAAVHVRRPHGVWQ